MTIVKKFTPEEAAAFLAECRATVSENPGLRFGQAVINNLTLRGMLLHPEPDIFYTQHKHEVMAWFAATWVATEE
jgi:hypothetical protein